MSRQAREFLRGFQQAALLAQRILASPPTYMSAKEYLEDVADLHAAANDLVRRGLAAGCLSALGKA
jgi:hypothetical protein